MNEATRREGRADLRQNDAPSVAASEDRVVYSWAKNRDEEVRATIGSFKGRRVVGLRVWVADANDNHFPTKRGLTIAASALPHLRAAIDALERAVAGDDEQAAA